MRRLVSVLTLALALAGVSGCSSSTPSSNTPSSNTSSTTAAPSSTPSSAGSAPGAGPSGTPTPTPPADARLVLGLGDSLAAGYQPGRGDVRDTAYPARFAQLLTTRGTPTAVVNLGCSGETASSMVDGGRCTYPRGSQLAQAEAELRAREGHVAAVTLDIGANDVLSCLDRGGVDPGCASEAVGSAAAGVDTILTRLRNAAGPGVPIALVLYYDPFQVVPVITAENKAAIHEQWQHLNTALATKAAPHGATVVDLGAVFGTDSTGSAPTTDSPVCQLTWMCTQGDFHLTDTGAEKVAQAIGDALPALR